MTTDSQWQPRFGDYAWFRKLSLNNSLSLLDRLPDDGVADAHGPNRACSVSQDIWNFEKIKLHNASIMEAYFLPLSTCPSDDPAVNKCGRRNLWQRLTNGWFESNTSKPKLKPQSKARAGERKRKPEARLTISPLECSGFSWVDLFYVFLLD